MAHVAKTADDKTGFAGHVNMIANGNDVFKIKGTQTKLTLLSSSKFFIALFRYFYRFINAKLFSKPKQILFSFVIKSFPQSCELPSKYVLTGGALIPVEGSKWIM